MSVKTEWNWNQNYHCTDLCDNSKAEFVCQ